MAEIICPQCKASNRGTSQYCSECGTPLLGGLGKQEGEAGPGRPPAAEEDVGAERPPAPSEERRSAPSEAHEVGTEGEAQQAGAVGAAQNAGGPRILQNRYRIEEQLGKGGFGSVYKVWDLNLNRYCAIKENLATSPEAQRQFMREATTLANLNHPNLPRVTDHFIIPEQGQYLVMDFVEGDDLESILKKREIIPAGEALEWIVQVAGALDYLHSRRPPLLHRDIKPANIRITPRGQAMLVDFGLVKAFDPQVNTTQGARAITPGYAPPEQYGRGGTDERTDIYGLGASLYHLVSGHEPLESVRRMAGEHQPPAHQLNPEVSLQLSDAIERSLALEPSQRFQRAADFRAALQASQAALEKGESAEKLMTVMVEPDLELQPAPVPAAPLTRSTARPVDPTMRMTGEFPSAPPAAGGMPAAPPRQGRNIWIFLIAGAALLVLCLGVTGGLAALLARGGGGSDSKTATAKAARELPVQATLTARAANRPTATTASVAIVPTATTIATLAPTGTTSPTETSEPISSEPTIGEIVFAQDVTEDNEPIDAGTRFQTGITRIYGIFEYSGLKEGMEISYFWEVSGKEFFTLTKDWEGDSSGKDWANTYYTDNSSLDAGNWILRIYIDGELMRFGTFTIYQ